MKSVTAAHLRRVVQRLDEEVMIRTRFYLEAEEGDERTGRKPGISAKTAASIWGEVTSGFAEATHSKRDELRVLDVNPAIGVRPPTTSDDREQAALYTDEVTMLLSSADVPRSRRCVYFVASYTGMRRSELERLTASDVDLEPALRPLLVELVALRPDGPLLDVPRADGKGGAADLVKRDLERAGLARADLTRVELFTNDATRKQLTFHDLRGTGITWLAIQGTEPLRIKTWAGHVHFSTTEGYIREAENMRTGFGDPFPPLPPQVLGASLIRPAESSTKRSAQSRAPKSRRPGRNSHVALATPPGSF